MHFAHYMTIWVVEDILTEGILGTPSACNSVVEANLEDGDAVLFFLRASVVCGDLGAEVGILRKPGAEIAPER